MEFEKDLEGLSRCRMAGEIPVSKPDVNANGGCYAKIRGGVEIFYFRRNYDNG